MSLSTNFISLAVRVVESDVSDSDTKKGSGNETESENEFESRKFGARKMGKGNLESPHKQGEL